LDRAGHHFLGVTEAVDGGRVDPVDTEFEGAVNGGNRVIVILRPPTKLPAAATERPGAEAYGVMSIFEFPSLRSALRLLNTGYFGFIRFDVGGRKKLNIPDLGQAGKAVPPVRCARRRRSASGCGSLLGSRSRSRSGPGMSKMMMSGHFAWPWPGECGG